MDIAEEMLWGSIPSGIILDHKENTSQVVPTYTVSNYQEIADLLIK